ncbi:hypothetical protein BGZ83_009411 [Gryganskiella cystojenkinii]|nr:hypothetical protein BGZ83_009411 [Gryganskiella cystojenkinii]
MNLLEIRLDVGARLSLRDLASCARVSIQWNETFTLLLYASCDASHSSAAWPSFQQHLHQVRDLRVHTLDTNSEYDQLFTKCRALTSLEFAATSNQYDLYQGLLTLLECNPCLRKVQALCNFQSSSRIIDILVRSCRQLQELTLRSLILEDKVLVAFLELAPRLTKLSLTDCWPRGPTNNEINSRNSSNDGDQSQTQPWLDQVNANWPIFPRLRELSVSGFPGIVSWKDQFRYFAQAPNLESIHWDLAVDGHGFLSTQFLVTLGAILKSGLSDVTVDDGHITDKREHSAGCPWPRLDMIQITGLRSFDERLFTDSLLADILRNCPNGLRRLDVPRADLGPLSWIVLRERHFQTLQIAALQADGWMTQEILSSCSQLQEFHSFKPLHVFDVANGVKAAKLREDDMVVARTARWLQHPANELGTTTAKTSTPTNDSAAAPAWAPWAPPLSIPRPWICSRLRVFRVELERMTRDRYEEEYEKEEDIEEVQRCNRQVFDRLVQLKELEDLILCMSMSTIAAGLDRTQYPVYLGIDTSGYEDRDLEYNFTFGSELRSHREIQEFIPVGSRLLEIWPRLQRCRLSR